VASEIKEKTDKGEVQCMSLDLSSLESVRTFTQQFKEKKYPLNVLINNAGIYKPPLARTVEGHESQFGVNYLGHFLLTNLLLNNVVQSAPSRIINVSSRAHERGTINFDDIDSEKSYSPDKGYSQSKLANVLFTYELHRRLAAKGIQNVTVNSLHPGVVNTNIFEKYLGTTLYWLASPFTRLLLKTPQQGAETSIYLATSPEVEGVSGKYFVDKKENPSSPLSYNEDDAKRLWKVSKEMCKLDETI